MTATNPYGPTEAISDETDDSVDGLPPVNTSLPTISGTTTQGQTLTASNGSWTNSPTDFAYQWQRCDGSGANCSDISDADSSSYTLVYADAGSTIRVVVTATNDYDSTNATSGRFPATGTVTGLAPANTALPAISGTAIQGHSLTASNGSWGNSPTSYAYQWRRCDGSGNNCANISSATSSSYTLALADVNSTIRVVVTATNAYGSPGATSGQTTPVSGAPENTSLPTISGTATQGQNAHRLERLLDNSPDFVCLPVAPLRYLRARTAPTSPAPPRAPTRSSSPTPSFTIRVVVTATTPTARPQRPPTRRRSSAVLNAFTHGGRPRPLRPRARPTV